MSDGHESTCPSGQPDLPNARVFAIATGTEEKPELAWLEHSVPVTPELLAKTGAVEPQRIFRIAVACQESRCVHFDGTNCKLAQRVVGILPEFGGPLPRCSVRSSCRWFSQEGRAACQRCPFILTHNYEPTDDLTRAATPT